MFYDILNAQDNIDMNGAPPFAPYSQLNFSAVPNSVNAPVTYLGNPFGSVGETNPFPTHILPSNVNWGAAGAIPWGASTDSPHLRTPYVYQYNLSIQQEITPGLIAALNYIGSDSKDLVVNQAVNPMILGTTNRVLNLNQSNPQITSFCSNLAALNGINVYSFCPFQPTTEYTNAGYANYNALAASLTKQYSSQRFGNSFFTFAYTWGKSLDNATGRSNFSQAVPYYQTGALYGPSDFDVAQRIAFSGGWDLPFDHTWSSAPKWLAKGWSLYPILSWQTGYPLTISADLPTNYDNAGPSGAGDPSLVNALYAPGYGSVQYLNPKSGSTAYYFNPNGFTNNQYADSVPCNQQNTINELPSNACAMANPAMRTYGLARNFFFGPGRTNLDLALAKKTRISERVNSEFRVEAFNIFNHTEFQSPNTNLYSGIFGQITSTYNPRILQLALRFTF